MGLVHCEELAKILYGKYYFPPVGERRYGWNIYQDYIKECFRSGRDYYDKLAGNSETNNGNNIGRDGQTLNKVWGAMIVLHIIHPLSILRTADYPINTLILFDTKVLMKALIDNISVLQLLDNLVEGRNLCIDICKVYEMACDAALRSNDCYPYVDVSQKLAKSLREDIDRFINGTYGVTSDNIRIVTSYKMISRVIKSIVGILYTRALEFEFESWDGKLTRFIYSMAAQLEPKLILTLKETRVFDVMKSEIMDFVTKYKSFDGAKKESYRELVGEALKFESSTELLIRELMIIGAYAPDILFKYIFYASSTMSLTLYGFGDLLDSIVINAQHDETVRYKDVASRFSKVRLRESSIRNIWFFQQIFYLVRAYPFILNENMRSKDKKLAQLIKEYGCKSQNVRDYLFRMNTKVS